MSKNFDEIPESEDGVDSAFDRYTKNVHLIQKNTIWNAAEELTEKSTVGFTREQLAKYINFDINIVNYWIRLFIEQNDILVDTSGMLSVNKNS